MDVNYTAIGFYLWNFAGYYLEVITIDTCWTATILVAILAQLNNMYTLTKEKQKCLMKE